MVGERKAAQEGRSLTGEAEQNFPAIGASVFTADSAVLGEAVHELDSAVMPDPEALGQLADGGSRCFGEAFQRKKELMLLRLQAVLVGGFRAELEVAADLVAKFGQSAVFREGEIGRHTYIVARYKYKYAIA